MGTRGLTAVIQDGRHRVAQYGQWDHYPTGQGTTALEFCCNKLNCPAGRERFRTAVEKTRFVDADEYRKLWESIGVYLDQNNGMVSMDKSNEFSKLYPHLSRDCGAEILELVLDGATDLQDSFDFARESLFCEYCYVVDLDKSCLEIHEGFQEAPHLRGRFSSLAPRDEYYPVMLVAEFDLSHLPSIAAVPAIMGRLEKMLNLDRNPEDYAEEAEEGTDDIPSITGKLPREVAMLARQLVTPKARPDPLKRFSVLSRPREDE
ncbi:hypothetical protein LCGC14_0755140 [marine sediment metagenome]|uniref:Uncharacterized protein n=1 Tax=marine sediment metagenome TaxID=412755 RepID=A0A0F9Q2Y0_9ZZZZ